MAQILDKQVKENANSTESDGSLSDEKTFTSRKKEGKKDDDPKERQYGELVIPADAMEEPSWCFIADTIEATIFRSRKGAGKAVAELTTDLINDDVLTMRVRAVEHCLIVESFLLILMVSFVNKYEHGSWMRTIMKATCAN